jgi:phosphinothricin acetyltransferase
MDIRETQLMDCARLAEIYNQYLGITTFDLTPKSADHFQQTLISLSAKEKMYTAWLPTDRSREQIIGWGAIKKYSEREGYRFTCETSVYLDGAYRKQGFGTQMKKCLIEQCRTLGYRYLVAKVLARNQHSIDYNVKLGYRVVGTQKRIGQVQGEWLDVVIMEYWLD